MEKKTGDLLFLLGLGIFILLLGLLYFEVRDNKAQCIFSPYTYAAKNLEKSNHNSTVSCACSLGLENVATLNFNSSTVWQIVGSNLMSRGGHTINFTEFFEDVNMSSKRIE